MTTFVFLDVETSSGWINKPISTSAIKMVIELDDGGCEITLDDRSELIVRNSLEEIKTRMITAHELFGKE